MWGVNHPTLLETQNFMTPCYFGAPRKPTKARKMSTKLISFIFDDMILKDHMLRYYDL